MAGLYLVKAGCYNSLTDTDEQFSAFTIAENLQEAITNLILDIKDPFEVSAYEVIPSGYADIHCVIVPNDPDIITAIEKINDF